MKGRGDISMTNPFFEIVDSLRWYCEKEDCREIVYQESFHCVDLGTQLKPVIERFAESKELRTCKKCGYLNSHK